MSYGQPETFEELHRAEQAAVFRYILGRVWDNETAEDLTVETFVRACRHWDKYKADPPAPPREWIYKVAEMVCNEVPPRNPPPFEQS